MESSKRQARLERRRSQQRQSQIKWLGYLVAAAVIITVLLILAQQISGPRVVAYSQKNGVSLGNPEAPVTLVEFADFQCSFCQQSYNQTEASIIGQYVDTGDANYTYQIVGFLGPESVAAAEAAYCAADQNYFWEYHDILFAPLNFSHGNSGGYTEEKLVQFAQQVNGIDMDAFNQCLASDEKLAQISAAESLASSLGISGTPGYVINGAVLPGFQPLEALQRAIEAALAAVSGN
ncbi:MAG: thioredoxin domain-containing protein [Anaerolineales bacterium]